MPNLDAPGDYAIETHWRDSAGAYTQTIEFAIEVSVIPALPDAGWVALAGLLLATGALLVRGRRHADVY